MQIAQNGLAQTRVEVVVEHLDDAAQVLELLKLLSVRADGHQYGANTVAQNSVRESGCVVRVLDLQQFFHALLRHLLDVFLISLEELEEDADNFGLDLNYVEVKRSLQACVVHRYRGGWRLLAISRII